MHRSKLKYIYHKARKQEQINIGMATKNKKNLNLSLARNTKNFLLSDVEYERFVK